MVIMKAQKILSTQEVKKNLEKSGMSIRSWAIKNGFTPSLVSGVLSGRIGCRFGKSHKIAVLLGIKNGEIVGD